MSLYVLLHGNPGSPEDLLELNHALRERGATEVVALSWRDPQGCPAFDHLDAEIEKVLAQAKTEHWCLVGYSYGAYVALGLLAQQGSLRQSALRHRPALLTLINPYLVVDKPLSVAARAVLSTPGLGSFILGRGLAKRATDFVDNVFAPTRPAADIRANLTSRLNSTGCWRQAASAKQFQQDNPLAPVTRLPCPGVVFNGAEDKVSRWSVHKDPLRGVNAHLRIEVVENAGHALPWTHTEQLAQTITDKMTTSL